MYDEPSVSGTGNYLHMTMSCVVRCPNHNTAKTFFSSLKCPDKLWGPQSLQLNWYH